VLDCPFSPPLLGVASFLLEERDVERSPASTAGIPGKWLISARGLEHEAAYWLRHLVRRWVTRFGAQTPVFMP
jgi:hypothetical protein